MRVRVAAASRLARLALAALAAIGAAGDATVDLDPTATEPRVVAEAGGSPSPGACGPTPGVLTNATGVVTDGSGRDGWYLPNVDCRWIVRPDVLAGTRGSRGSGGDGEAAPASSSPSSSPPAGITLVFEAFSTVFDEDFLYVTDASDDVDRGDVPDDDDDDDDALAARSLGLYTGRLPVPFAARFDGVEALALRFVSRGGVRDAGFRVRYLADGACFNDCGGRGACEAALCACDPGWAGADCSIPLPTLPANGSALDGVVAPGETKYFRVRVDGDEAPSDPRALVIELTIPPRSLS